MVKDFGMVLIYPFIIKPKICNLTLGKRERGQPTHGLSPALSKLSWSRIHHRRLYRWREDAVARGVGVVGLSYGQLRSGSRETEACTDLSTPVLSPRGGGFDSSAVVGQVSGM
ncbi:unnamed protein product [Brassica oleracea var. botrytis]